MYINRLRKADNMSRFTTIALANDLVLVEGYDVRGVHGQTTVSALEWNKLKADRSVAEAHEAFDAALSDFYAPIIAAAEKLEDAHVVELDSLCFIVEQEAVEGRPAQEQRVRRLSAGSIILRAIESGNDDRLIWVNDELVLTATPVEPEPEAPEVVGTEPTA